MYIPKRTRIISAILKLIVIISATVGISIVAYASRNTFMGGRKMFMYFTIQSNIAIALISLIGLFLLVKGARVNETWHVIKFVGTISITLTCGVFTFMLAPTMGAHAWSLSNTLTHMVVPVVAILDFFLIGAYGDLKKKNVVYVIIPPLAYAIYAGIGYAAKWEFAGGVNYPYFFLNWGSPAGAFGFTKELPFMGSAWWILLLFVLLLVVGYIYILIVNVIKKLMNNCRKAVHSQLT